MTTNSSPDSSPSSDERLSVSVTFEQVSQSAAALTQGLKQGFKKVCRTVSSAINPIKPVTVVQAALIATACGAVASVPNEYVGEAAAAAAAAATASAAVIGGGPALGGGMVLDSKSNLMRDAVTGGGAAVRRRSPHHDDDNEKDSDEESDGFSVEDDSAPIRTQRQNVSYTQDETELIECDQEEFRIQLKRMKLNKSYFAYPNQTTVANQLHSNFLNPQVVIQMAIGYTQSGKTGCMVGLIDRMMTSQETLIHISNIYIITGLSSCDWMKQTKVRIPECMRVHVFHNGNLDTFKKEVSGKQNILVIIDEAHMASRKKQTMSRIFKELSWKLDFMMENDIKLVQFSATPDGLIFALNGPKWPERHYRIVTIQPGTGYFGAKQMHLLGNLKPAVDIYGRKKDGEWVDEATHNLCIGNFVQILRDQLSFDEPRYLVIRIRGGAQEPNYEKNLYESLGRLHDSERDQFEPDESCVRRYDMNGNVDSISELLFKSPKKHTIIFVKEKMKCAQTLEHIVVDTHGKHHLHSVKHNIGVMVERRRNSDVQNDSFSIQGFMGRLCGYQEHDCICYTNVESYEKYEKLFECNFDSDALKRVSWNSNTTTVRVNGSTIALPNVNHECIEEPISESEAIKMCRIYKDEDDVRKACKFLGYTYRSTKPNEAGFKETSLNAKTGVASLNSAVMKVKSGYGTNNGEKTYRTCYPCYVDPEDSATLRFVVIIRPDTDPIKLEECDTQVVKPLTLTEAMTL